MLVWLLRLLIAITAFVGSSEMSVRAAEIECVSRYDGTPIPDVFARKYWPSGFRPIAGMCSHGFLHGDITKGDYEKVRSFYRANHRVLRLLFLQSPGGEVPEALKIGRLMRKYLTTAIAPLPVGNGSLLLPPPSDRRCDGSDCICASACALIWFGAVDRVGRVGLHRPRIQDTEFKALAPAEAGKVYRQLLDSIAHYLDEMEVPRPMIDAMVATGSAEIRWVSSDIDGLERTPSFAEWAQASCGAFTNEEMNSMISLRTKRDGTGLTGNDAMLLQMLTEKDFRRTRCENELISAHLDQLAPP
jgi:hypothetical protein